MPEVLFSIPTGDHLLNGPIHKRVVKEAQAAGIKIYVVGGYLRDLVISAAGKNRPSKDLDYAVAGGKAVVFAKKLADILKGNFVLLDKANDTARVVMNDGFVLDFAGCVGDSLSQDILRRDFTINSLYLDPEKPDKIVDLVGGLEDICSKKIRSLDVSVLTADPLRLLRALRFAASFDFTIEPQTLSWIKKHAKLLKNIAGERISTELFTIFSLPTTKTALLIMAQTGLLEAIFPELKATRDVTNNSHHHLNLFDHSLETVNQAEQAYISIPVWDNSEILEDVSFAVSRLAACKIACLLHDIGKPETWVITEAGKHTFIGHERLGAQMIANVAHRLRWSKQLERLITKLVRFHLRPGQLFHNGMPTKQAVNRLFRQTGADFPALVLLAFGDLGATQGPSMIGEKSIYLRQNFINLLSEYYEFSMAAKSMEKLLDGKDVMKILKLQPGKEVGYILTALKEAQEIKEVVNRAQAEAFIQSVYKKNKKEV